MKYFFIEASGISLSNHILVSIAVDLIIDWSKHQDFCSPWTVCALDIAACGGVRKYRGMSLSTLEKSRLVMDKIQINKNKKMNARDRKHPSSRVSASSEETTVIYRARCESWVRFINRQTHYGFSLKCLSHTKSVTPYCNYFSLNN